MEVFLNFLLKKMDLLQLKNLKVNNETKLNLENNLLLFFLPGFSRDSSTILNEQNKKTIKNNKEIIHNLDFTKFLGYEIKKALLKGDCDKFGKLMDEHWKHKLKDQAICRTELSMKLMNTQ